MTLFQIIMFLATAFFAYQVFIYIQNIDEDAEPAFMKEPEVIEQEVSLDELMQEADQAYMDDKVDKAQSLLEDIVRAHPAFAEGMNKLAFVLAKQGDNESAQSYYEASLGIEPNDDMTHNALATLLSSMDKNEEAEEHYKKAIEIDDNYEITWFNYANLMLKLERNTEARVMYQRVLDIDPEFEQAKEELEKLT